jgi:glycosyltransferase 2 family protein
VKKKILIPLKFLITGLILWWVFHKNGKEKLIQIGQTIQTANPGYLALGLLMYFSVLALGICRWQLLLRAQGIHLSAFRAIWLTAAGTFFNTFLPGATGGDVLKAWYVSQAAPTKKAHAILSIVVDRGIGLFGLLILAGTSVLLYSSVLFRIPETKPIAIFVLATLASLIIVIFMLFQRKRFIAWPIAQWIWKWMPAKELFKKLAESIDLYETHPFALSGALAISISVHCVIVLAAYFIGQAIHLQGVGILQYYVYCPLINAFAAIPATPGGLGLREKAFQFFFSLDKVPEAQSLALSLLFYAGTLIVGILCGIVYTVTKPEGTPIPKEASVVDLQV